MDEIRRLETMSAGICKCVEDDPEGKRCLACRAGSALNEIGDISRQLLSEVLNGDD